GYAQQGRTRERRDRTAALRPRRMARNALLLGTRARRAGVDRSAHARLRDTCPGRGIRARARAVLGRRAGAPEPGDCGDQRLEPTQRGRAHGARGLRGRQRRETARGELIARHTGLVRRTVRESARDADCAPKTSTLSTFAADSRSLRTPT